MKELEPLKVMPDQQLIAEAQKEYTLKYKIRKVRGQILFAVYPSDGWRIERVKIKSNIVIGLDGKKRSSHQAHFDPNAIYMYAINEANALKKVKRELFNFIRKNEIKSNMLHSSRQAGE